MTLGRAMSITQVWTRIRRCRAVLVLALLATGCETSGGRNDTSRAGDSGQRPVQQALVGDPIESARIRSELAFIYFQRGQMSIALDEVRAAINSDPKYPTAYNVLGLIHMDLGQNQEAESAFRRALALAPNDSDTLNNFGWFLCQTKRERESIPQFLLALKNPLYPTPDKPYLNAGICAQRLGDEGAAEDYFSKAFQLDPLNAGAMLRLAELYFKRNEIEKARFYVDRTNKNFNPSAESLWLALRIERKAGDHVSESSYAAQLRRRYPNSNEHLLMQQGKFE